MMATVFKVFISDYNDMEDYYPESIAYLFETTYEVEGSSIYRQTGRWKGKSEDGWVIEVAVPYKEENGYGYNTFTKVEPKLKDWLRKHGLTALVTETETSMREVY